MNEISEFYKLNTYTCISFRDICISSRYICIYEWNRGIYSLHLWETDTSLTDFYMCIVDWLLIPMWRMAHLTPLQMTQRNSLKMLKIKHYYLFTDENTVINIPNFLLQTRIHKLYSHRLPSLLCQKTAWDSPFSALFLWLVTVARVTFFFRDCYKARDKAHSSYQWMDQLLKHFKGKQLSLYITEAIQGKQLNHKIVLCWQEMASYLDILLW